MGRKSTNGAVPASERDWKAQSDARTLAEAKAINCDPKRVAAAAKAAKEMIVEHQTQLNGLKHVARKAK